MAIERSLVELMQQSVTVAPYSSVNDYGEATYGTGVAYTCRISGKSRLLHDAQGREWLVVNTITLSSAPALSPRDKVTLADGSTPPLLAVETVYDEAGAHHVVLSTGAAGSGSGLGV